MTGQTALFAAPAPTCQGALADEFGTLNTAAAPTLVPGAWVRYHGSLIGFVGQIMQIKRAYSTHLTLETATGGILRCVRPESVTLDTP